MNLNLTLIGQSIAFLAFVWFNMKFVWPPILNAMKERENKMASGLQNAEKATRDLEAAQESAQETIREAKQQAAELIEQANRRAAQLVDEAKNQAQDEGDRLKAAAQNEIEQEAQRARETLRKQVSELAIAGAEKILQSEVDRKAHAEMLDQLAKEL